MRNPTQFYAIFHETGFMFKTVPKTIYFRSFLPKLWRKLWQRTSTIISHTRA